MGEALFFCWFRVWGSGVWLVLRRVSCVCRCGSWLGVVVNASDGCSVCPLSCFCMRWVQYLFSVLCLPAQLPLLWLRLSVCLGVRHAWVLLLCDLVVCGLVLLGGGILVWW